MRKDDSGAIAVLTAILAVVLFGFSALVIDVSMLYSERRELQNGADATALAVAGRCSADKCAGVTAASITGEGQTYADGAALDQAENLELCGSLSQLGACDPAVTGVPSGALGYVKAVTRTGTSAIVSKMPPIFAKVANPDYDGKTVKAAAVAVWGIPKSMRTLPITFSKCEFNALTSNRTQFAPPPPYANGLKYPAGYTEDIVFFKRPVDSQWPAPYDPTSPDCADLYNKGPGHDGPGGFGWLPTDGDVCEAVLGEGDVVDANPGADVPQPCKKTLDDWIGHVVGIPIYQVTNDSSGSNLQYTLAGYAGYLLTGYHLRGSVKEPSYVTGAYCNANLPAGWPNGSSMDCISGFFVTGVVPGTGTVGGGTDYGARIVQLIK